MSCFDFQQPWGEEVISNYWLKGFVMKSNIRSELSPSEIIDHLSGKEIESRPFWKPMHLQPLYKDAERVGGKVSEAVFNSGVCLPSGVGLTEHDLDRIVSSISELLVSRGLLE